MNRPALARLSGAVSPSLLILVLFCVALAIRLYGIRFGLPYVEEVDEPAIMDRALDMLQKGKWNPHWFNYPSLYIYAEAFVTWVYYQWGHWHGLYTDVSQLSGVYYNWHFLPQPDTYAWGRALTALLGALNIPVLYAAGARLYNRAVGLVAAALLAFTFLHAQYSHYIRTDVPLTLFITGALFFSANVYRWGRARDYLLAGICVGLATGVKYNGAPIAAAVIAAHLARFVPFFSVRPFRSSIRLLDPHVYLPLLVAAAGGLIGFVVGNPFVFSSFGEYQYWFQWVRDFYGNAGPQPDQFLYYLSYFWLREGFGLILTPLALLGLILSILRHRGEDAVTLAFPLVYFLIIFQYANRNIRTGLPFTPFLALWAALALVLGIRWLAGRKPFLAQAPTFALPALTFLLLLPPALKIWQEDARMDVPGTRAQATAWAIENLPSGARVKSEPGGIYLGSPFVDLEPGTLDRKELAVPGDREVDYLVTADDTGGDTPRTWPDSLQLVQAFSPQDKGYERVIRIWRAPPLPLQLLDARIENQPVMPGHSASLVLHWRTTGELKGNYAGVVRVLGDGPEPIQQLSERPQQGNGKTKRWPIGRVITDTHTISLPWAAAPGVYQVEVGFAREDSSIPLALPNADGLPVEWLPAGEIQIGPAPH